MVESKKAEIAHQADLEQVRLAQELTNKRVELDAAIEEAEEDSRGELSNSDFADLPQEGADQRTRSYVASLPADPTESPTSPTPSRAASMPAGASGNTAATPLSRTTTTHR